MTEPLRERLIYQQDEAELFVQVEKALTEADAVVEIDRRLWRVVDFVRDNYAMLVLQTGTT